MLSRDNLSIIPTYRFCISDMGKSLPDDSLKALYYAFLERPNITERTRKSYRSRLGPFVQRHAYKSVGEVDRALMQEYLDSLDVAYSTHRQYQKSFKSFFDYAVAQGYCDRNPVLGIPLRQPDASKGEHRETEEIRYLDERQLQILFAALERSPNVRLRLLVVLLYRTGCRVSEVLNLNRTELDLKNRSFDVVGKGNKRRTCYYAPLEADSNDMALSLLQEYFDYYHDGSEPLLLAEDPVRRRVTRLGYEQARLDWHALVDSIPELSGAVLHDIRHTFATQRVGVLSLEDLQALMGHAQLATTMRYAKVSPRRAAASARQAFDSVDIY